MCLGFAHDRRHPWSDTSAATIRVHQDTVAHLGWVARGHRAGDRRVLRRCALDWYTRFDGSRMEVPTKVQPLMANSIFTLATGRDGTLWAGTEGGGLLRLHNGQVKSYSARDGLTDGFVRKVLEDHHGRLWVGTDDGLFVMDATMPNAQLRRVDVGQIAPLAVHAIAEDHTGRIWVGGSRLIALNPDGTATQFALPGAYSQNRVKSLLETRDGRMWIGTVGGLQYLQSGQFHTVEGNPRDCQNAARSK
jgi:ligand-binding sensor domain-containing protein